MTIPKRSRIHSLLSIEDQEVVKISNIILQHFEKTADANLPLLIINFAFLCVKCQSFLGNHDDYFSPLALQIEVVIIVVNY